MTYEVNLILKISLQSEHSIVDYIQYIIHIVYNHIQDKEYNKIFQNEDAWDEYCSNLN